MIYLTGGPLDSKMVADEVLGVYYTVCKRLPRSTERHRFAYASYAWTRIWKVRKTYHAEAEFVGWFSRDGKPLRKDGSKMPKKRKVKR